MAWNNRRDMTKQAYDYILAHPGLSEEELIGRMESELGYSYAPITIQRARTGYYDDKFGNGLSSGTFSSSLVDFGRDDDIMERNQGKSYGEEESGGGFGTILIVLGIIFVLYHFGGNAISNSGIMSTLSDSIVPLLKIVAIIAIILVVVGKIRASFPGLSLGKWVGIFICGYICVKAFLAKQLGIAIVFGIVTYSLFHSGKE